MTENSVAQDTPDESADYGDLCECGEWYDGYCKPCFRKARADELNKTLADITRSIDTLAASMYGRKQA